jgi:hypothetical protein
MRPFLRGLCLVETTPVLRPHKGGWRMFKRYRHRRPRRLFCWLYGLI